MTEFKVPYEMDLFFKRLNAIKAQVKKALELGIDAKNVSLFLESLYQQLHEIYKTQEEANAENNDDDNDSCSRSDGTSKCDRPE